ncbi:MAG: 2-oxoglutarate dehydrogenase complex dihydrolipoyllysine-residue succinyltransferase [Phycisphaerales bacterium]|nr:2-oxoglutarate dehydrogenase complex dihydrolipoyllysine-residue succinyltransferase [Phycisphaerales bacterium]
MSTEIVIPPMGESITEGIVATWLKGDGEYVERDEEIVEIETDKITMPVPSPASGVLKHTAHEGDTIEVGGVVGAIDESAKAPEKAAASKSEPAKAEKKSEPKPAPAPAASKPAPAAAPSGGGGGGTILDASRITPVAKKLADENHLDLSGVSGTGPGGRIREQDVLALMQTRKNGSASSGSHASAPVAAPGARGVRRERMTPLRQKIASRLVEAQHTAAMLTTFNECDMTNVMGLRSAWKDEFEKMHGVKLGFMSFFVKAACSALKKFPNVNASIVDGEKGPEVEYHDYCDVAVAVGTDKGLVVPVLRNADGLDFAGVESGILELAHKARENRLTLEDMQGGTFTISNGGVYGSMMSTPILNPPQSGILGMHNIIRRAVENPDKPGSGEVVIRPMMYLALSYDHRIVDGAGAVGFLKHVKECIEDPRRMLLGV